MKKLFILSDGEGLPTGFSNEINPLLPFFRKKYTVHYHSFQNDKSQKNVDDIISKFKPDIILFNQDIQNLGIVSNFSKKIPIVSWTLIDIPVIPQNLLQTLGIVDYHIFQSQFALDVLSKYTLGIKNRVQYPPIDSDYIATIQPLYLNKSKQIVFVNTTNQLRKNPQLIFQISEHFKNVEFVVNYKNCKNSMNMEFLRSYFNSENVIFTDEFINFDRTRYENIISLYKASDLYLSVSGREGFGYTLLEAMACDTPIVALETPTVKEILNGDRGSLIPKGSSYMEEGYLENNIANIENFIQPIRNILENKFEDGIDTQEFLKKLTPETVYNNIENCFFSF